jgi:peptidoglycan/LPS O-acetylase OafA/YrhL
VRIPSRSARLAATRDPGSPRRLPGIEGLRAVAASSVVLHHVWLLDGGERVGHGGPVERVFLNLALGVTLFFALSGFLLYRPFAAAIARSGPMPSIRNYLRNRALRILPAYWTILLVATFVLQTTSVRVDAGTLGVGALTDPAELVASALLIQNYNPNTMVIGIGPAWSLAVEVVFYLLLPLLAVGAAMAARTVVSRRRRVVVLLGPPALLLVIGLTGKFVAAHVVPGTSPGAGWGTNWHSVIERSFWAQSDLFAFGMAAAVLHTEVTDRTVRLPSGWRLPTLAVSVILLVLSMRTLGSAQLSYLPANTVVAFCAAALLMVVTFPWEGARPPRLTWLLEHRSFVFVGLISYSLFLWNEPVIRWLTERGITQPGWSGLAFNIVVSVAVVGVLSVLTYRFVERPALRRKRRVAGEPAPLPVPSAQVEAAP